MTSTTFVLADRPDIKEKFAATAARLPDGSLLPNPPLEGLVPPTHGGGAGSYSSAPDYLKIITAVLKNEGLLLKKETMLELFEPQIDAELIRKNILSEPMMARLAGVSEEMSFNWALGGLILTGDAPDGRTKGTLSWGGLPNLYWVSFPSEAEMKPFLTQRSSSTLRRRFAGFMPARYFHRQMRSRSSSTTRLSKRFSNLLRS